MPTIRLENVTKTYRGENAISNVNLTIEQGEFVFLIGSRGAGKSTLLNVLSGEKRPSAGTVWLDDDPVGPLNLLRRARLRELTGRVDQRSTLSMSKTVGANLRPKGLFARIEDRFDPDPLKGKALGLVGMGGTEKKKVKELSAPDRHRVEIAKAIVTSPAILILDEITDKMDDDTIWDILHLISELNAHGTTVIMVTNAGRFINIMRKRVITLADGKIVGDVRNGRYDTLGRRGVIRK